MGTLADLAGSPSFHDTIDTWNLQMIKMDHTWIQIIPKTFLGYFGPQKQPLLGFNLIVNLGDGRFYLTLFSKVKLLLVIWHLKQTIISQVYKSGHLDPSSLLKLCSFLTYGEGKILPCIGRNQKQMDTFDPTKFSTDCKILCAIGIMGETMSKCESCSKGPSKVQEKKVIL